MTISNRDDKYLRAARRIFTHIAEVTDLHFCIRLWNDYIIPMGDNANPEIYISISSPGVLGAVLPWKMCLSNTQPAALTTAAVT